MKDSLCCSGDQADKTLDGPQLTELLSVLHATLKSGTLSEMLLCHPSIETKTKKQKPDGALLHLIGGLLKCAYLCGKSFSELK